MERLKRIKYHWITGHPTYKNTTYVEVEAANMLSNAYSYPKQIKDKWIKEDILRFECKFYQAFFRRHEDDMLKAISKTVNNYAVMFIDNSNVRNSMITKYNEQLLNKKIDLKAMPTRRYKHDIDMDYVGEFISMLMTIDDVFTYDTLMPSRDREALSEERK